MRCKNYQSGTSTLKLLVTKIFSLKFQIFMNHLWSNFLYLLVQQEKRTQLELWVATDQGKDLLKVEKKTVSGPRLQSLGFKVQLIKHSNTVFRYESKEIRFKKGVYKVCFIKNRPTVVYRQLCTAMVRFLMKQTLSYQ